ncbi:MAG: heavy metal translocating P-type ATPase, partial [Limisphaerales bacterium]
SLERLSTHPLARAITLYGKQHAIEPLPLARFESITGYGLRAKWNDKDVFLGKRDWILTFNGRFASRPPGMGQSALPAASPVPLAAETQAGVSEIWVSCGELLGRVLLRDDIRPQAADVLNQLRREQLRTVVLTGDRKSAAQNLKERLGLDDVRAELKPEEKVAAIHELSVRDRVAMVGDGVNDAPSLAAAHIGVAMGARGADAALEQADVVLMHDKLENFLAAFRISRRARGIIRWNLFISLGTVAVLVTLAMFGKIPLTVGVVGHEGSTVVVVMNSLRLLVGKRQ